MSFYDLLKQNALTLPTTLSGARRVQSAPCIPTSYWGAWDFNNKDNERLRTHLNEIYTGKMTNPFVPEFAVRFLWVEEQKKKGRL